MSTNPGDTVRFYVTTRRWVEVQFDRMTATVIIRSNHPIFCHEGPTSHEVSISSVPEELAP